VKKELRRKGMWRRRVEMEENGDGGGGVGGGGEEEKLGGEIGRVRRGGRRDGRKR